MEFFKNFDGKVVRLRDGGEVFFADADGRFTALAVSGDKPRHENLAALQSILAIEPTEDCPASVAQLLLDGQREAQDKFDLNHPAAPGGLRGWKKAFEYHARRQHLQKDAFCMQSHWYGYAIAGRLFRAGDVWCIEPSETERWSAAQGTTNANGRQEYVDWGRQGFAPTDEWVETHVCKMQKWVKKNND